MTKRVDARKRWGAALLVAVGLVGAPAAQATLMARDLNGDTVTDAYYDNVLKITWLKDANYARTSGFDTDGLMTWAAANDWAENVLDFGGYTDWRLARINLTSPIATAYSCASGTAADCAASGNELGYMFYFNMDGSAPNTGTQIIAQPPDGPTGDATLDNIQNNYWSSTDVDSTFAWRFRFDLAFQSDNFKPFSLASWAVRPGDVAAVPEPASVLLLGIGALALGWSRRKK